MGSCDSKARNRWPKRNKELIKPVQWISECESDLILVSISDALCERTQIKRKILLVNMEHNLKNKVNIGEISIWSRHSVIAFEYLAQTWNIILHTAGWVLTIMTHRGIRTAIHQLLKRYRFDHLDLCWKEIKEKLYADWLLAKMKSITQWTGTLFLKMNHSLISIPKTYL